MTAGYESFFGLAERPFSLTIDTRYFFASRSHGRAVDVLTAGFRAKERFLLVTGDLGIGKTAVCRTLAEQLRRDSSVALIRNPLITSEAFNRLVLEDFALSSFEAFDRATTDAVIIIDEAHIMPPALVEHVLAFSRRHVDSQYVFRFAFVGQSIPGDPDRLGVADIDNRTSTTVRLLPLGREECAAYIDHRLKVAGPEHVARFSSRTYDAVFALSGGVPRLVNLLCERALQEAASVGNRTIGPSTIEAAASALQLLRTPPRRFRWFGRRVSGC